jgi:hypothetical protein
MREWREKPDWSKAIPECFLIIHPHKMEENQRGLLPAALGLTLIAILRLIVFQELKFLRSDPVNL